MILITNKSLLSGLCNVLNDLLNSTYFVSVFVVEDTTANAFDSVDTVGPCMTIILALFTLTNYFCFVQFFDFDFRE